MLPLPLPHPPHHHHHLQQLVLVVLHHVAHLVFWNVKPVQR